MQIWIISLGDISVIRPDPFSFQPFFIIMASSEFMSNYRLAEPTIRKLYDSGLRLAILDALKDKPMRLADLRRAVNANAPNTSSKAKELEEMGLLGRVDGDFKLTPFGQAILAQIDKSSDFYASYARFKDFWSTHHTEGIPLEFLLRIGELNDSTLLRCTKENPIATHEGFVDYLKSIKKEMYIMSPLFQTEWIKVIAGLMDKKVKMEFIFTAPILKMFATTAKELGRLKDFEKHAEFREVPETYSLPAFLSSDTFFCVSLESLSAKGNYLDMKIHSINPCARTWAKDMYSYYKSNYKPVKLSDYL